MRERTGKVVHLAGYISWIGQQPVEGNHRDERGDQREEGVERDTGRDECEVVAVHPRLDGLCKCRPLAPRHSVKHHQRARDSRTTLLLPRITFPQTVSPVSYTHLRAHETR